MYKSINTFRQSSLWNTAVGKRFYSSTEDAKLKTRVPIFRPNEAQEHISLGKLKESEHSVALYNLEFIKIDNIVNLSTDQLNRLVVIPKGDKLSLEARIEKLENELAAFRNQGSSSSTQQQSTSTVNIPPPPRGNDKL
ncbi:hypothetical protein SAMD00019534_092540 [Acytostelium subglobosum LB1]|uniref:hypothetical protein n=1 Tax=Acytostelium subglobosum LB1 TaxID=1410327 RepID=UPI0006448BD6|nr:hypothetical protein SAMD00019534_092540 [Acytostelium subglobosum LB1]GAM26079.1 hypothetical protein SAMD00019534_092540 [Acytostelium subglobosum LB1]|eukprot:XP_012751122.1 hypothetical protein SAMD00019534_092540 [Acytostelium subglobosum LB1]